MTFFNVIFSSIQFNACLFYLLLMLLVSVAVFHISQISFFLFCSLTVLFIFRCLKSLRNWISSISFCFLVSPSSLITFCVFTSRHPSVSSHLSARSLHTETPSAPPFYLLSSFVHQLLSCRLYSALVSPLTSPSFLCSPLSSAALQKTIRKVRGVASHFLRHLLSASTSFPASPPPATSAPVFFLLPSFFFLLLFSWSLPKLLSRSFSSCFPPVSHLCACQSRSLFNSPVPPRCPLRCFPNSRSRSGAAWLGPSLSSLRSRQERHWDSELWLLSTTTTRRLNSCWSGGFTDCCAYFLNWIFHILLASFIVNFQLDSVGFLDFNLWTSLNVTEYRNARTISGSQGLEAQTVIDHFGFL